MMTRNRRLGRKWWLTIRKNAVCQAEPPSASNGQLPSLTPLRGLAALWVVLYHYCVQCFPNLDIAHYTH